MTDSKPGATKDSIVGLLFADLEMELESTRRVLERFPDARADFRPHPKSRTAAELATHVADVVNRGTTVLETDFLEVGRRKLEPVTTAAGLVAFFDENAARLRAALAGADAERLAELWALRREGRVIGRPMPRRVAIRVIMLSHLVHHRAQLGVYYRLLDVPVPAVYGPTADEGFA